MLKYEDNFWGKTDFLHNQYKKNFSYYKDLIEIIEKIKKAYSSFSETIHGLFNKKSYFIEDQTSSFYALFQSFQCLIKSQSQQFNELSIIILKEIIEPYKKKSSADKDEENLYKELNDINKLLKKSKLTLDEKKNLFYNKMRETESLIIEEKTKKLKDYALNSIFDAQIEEDNYKKALEETNNLIERYNEKQKELLNFYQNNESKRLTYIKNNIYLLLTGIKGTYSTIISDIESVNKGFLKIDIKKDMNLFTKSNKSNSSPETKLNFVQYTPNTSLNDSLFNSTEKEKMNINYEVINHFQKFFNGICNNVDMVEEKTRYHFRSLCIKLFDDNEAFSKEDLNELINFIKSSEYRSYFLFALTNERSRGNFKMKEKLFDEIITILNTILDLAQKENNFKDAKNCMILSQTYYKELEVDDEVKKIYLMEYLKKNKWISNISFWKEFIELEISKEKEKFEEEAKKKNITPKNGRVKQIYFSKIITHSNNMKMFGLYKSDVMSISDFFMKKYELPDDLRKVIEDNIEEIFKEKKIVKKEKKKDGESNKKKEEEKKQIKDEWVIGCDDFSEVIDINNEFDNNENKSEDIKKNKDSIKNDNEMKNNQIKDKKESNNIDNNNGNKDEHEKSKSQTIEQFLYEQ